MPRFRRRTTLKGKVGIKKSGTFVENQGHGSAPDQFEIMITEGGARNIAGATTDIKANANTAELCNVGDTIKYVTLYLQVAGRPSLADPNNIPGWVEWAFVCVKESEANVPITQLGVQTLGDVCMKMFRNECIYTGCLSVGQHNPNNQEIKIKIPKVKQKIRLGDEWRFITFVRSNLSTDTSTDRIRIIKSFSYKCYS